MNVQAHLGLRGKIWEIANRLRGPYRPPQYRLVMLPMVVLRRLDCVLEPTKAAVLKQQEKLQAQQLPGPAVEKILGKAANPSRKHAPLYNTSPYTFAKLLEDPENIAPNLAAYINGFSPTAWEIFDKFKFAEQIDKLDASNRLFTIVQAMADVDLHPDRIDNLQMGYLFEYLVMRFNEQANEEAGDHFTPREVIRLMANLIYTGEEDVYKPGIYRTIYDPACGTGGMLSESAKLILAQNERANLALHGQEYNEESWAICCADMLIKDEDTGKIALGDTLGDGKTKDGFEGERFHYLMANPPFGVEWKDQRQVVEYEHRAAGFAGRFGAGIPNINDGSLLFLQHMIAKMHPYKEGDADQPGSKIAIVFNGSPLFSGDAGSGPSSIRRWIIENDWLDAIVALPDQLFYNTGILTYIWLVTNRKPKERRGKVQLIDASRCFQKMKKSLNNKRNEITEEQIRQLTRIYGNYRDGETAEVQVNGGLETRVVSRIFENREFGFLKVTVERPLRLNFTATPERIARLDTQTAFAKLATSKKRSDPKAAEKEIVQGRQQQEAIRTLLATLEPKGLYLDRAAFAADLTEAAKGADLKIPGPVKKAILTALGERDPKAEPCYDSKGNKEPDSELRDTEHVPLPPGTALPLPMDFGPDKPNADLSEAFRAEIDSYLEREVLPHRPDAWADHAKTKVAYEIPFNRHFYVYRPPRPLGEIEADITALEREIAEKRQALITQAVTDGLQGIPVSGRVERLKFAAEARNSTVDKKVAEDEVPVRLCNYTDVYYNDAITPDTAFMEGSATEAEVERFQLRFGQVIITKDSEAWDDIGVPALVAEDMPDVLCGYHLTVLDPGPELDGGFLAWYCRAEPLSDQFKVAANGVTRFGLGQYSIKNALIALPPLETQRRIARFLDEKTGEIDKQRELIEKSCTLLEEYRAALITAAVTGKIPGLQ